MGGDCKRDKGCQLFKFCGNGVNYVLEDCRSDPHIGQHILNTYN